MFNERFKKALEFRNKKPIDVAMDCGISKGAISMYLSNKRQPRTDIILKIANYLDISPAYLLGITDNMFYTPQLTKELKPNVDIVLINEIERNLLRLDETTLRMVNEMIKALVK